MKLHVITDTSIQDRFSHLELAEFAVRGGADVIQLRDKEMGTAALLGVALAMQALCKKAGVTFLVNDRVDIALLADADGVHLGQDDLPVPEARKILGAEKIIGGSAASPDEALALEKQKANYIGFGHIFPTSTKEKSSEPKGVQKLKDVCQTVKIPVVAIGGIDLSNLESVLEAKPAGIAVIRAVCASEDPEQATRQLKSILSQHSSLPA